MPYKDPAKQRAFQNSWLKRKRRSAQGHAVRDARRKARAVAAGAVVKDIHPLWEPQQLILQGRGCHWCGCYIGRTTAVAGKERVDFDADHIVPLSEGGEHSAANLVLACIQCNQERNPDGRYGRGLAPADDSAEVM